MLHPIQSLPHNGQLNPERIAQRRRRSSSFTPDPENPQRTIYTFRAGDVNDNRDRVIIADPQNGVYTATRDPGCVCRRFYTPIECNCTMTACDTCELEFAATRSTCQFQYCLYDDCPLCTHQRENCDAQSIEAQIVEARHDYAQTYTSETTASEFYAAIADVLGADTGEAPNLPVVRRILGNHLTTTDDRLSWTAPDNSVIHVDPSQPAWLNLD